MEYDFTSAKTAKVSTAMQHRVNGRLPWEGYGRSYDDPDKLIDAIPNHAHRLAAIIQREGGVRAEGVGFGRSEYSRFVIILANLHGISADPYFFDGRLVGVISTTEKGGYTSRHYISPDTYRDLEGYLNIYGKLGGNYLGYLRALEYAAQVTGQDLKGRGTHGLKHNFAQEFFRSAIAAGNSPESAKVETSQRCAHHRGDVFTTYYAGQR